MASVYPQSRGQIHTISAIGPRSLARGITVHTSLALMVFAVLQAVGVVALNDLPGGRWLPFIALAVLILIAVPFSRRVERRWRRMADQALPSSRLRNDYRRDRAQLWRYATIAPLLWIGSYSVVAQAAMRL